MEWKEGSSSWHPLCDIKNSFPIHLAEYAVKHELQDELAFKWWVREALKRRKYMLKAAKTHYACSTRKFGIQLPNSVEEALAIDCETNTTFRYDAIQKEMKSVCVAFTFLGDEDGVPIGYKWNRCHMVFDVKMDFTRKARHCWGTYDWSSLYIDLL